MQTNVDLQLRGNFETVVDGFGSVSFEKASSNLPPFNAAGLARKRYSGSGCSPRSAPQRLWL